MLALVFAFTLSHANCGREYGDAIVEVDNAATSPRILKSYAACLQENVEVNPLNTLLSLLLSQRYLAFSGFYCSNHIRQPTHRLVASSPIAQSDLFRSPAVQKRFGVSVRSAPVVAQEPGGQLPKLVVLDLDMCVWSPEMYLLDDMPDRPIMGNLNGRGEGVIGVHSGTDTIRIFPGALAALQDVADGKFPGMLLAVASSADTPLAEKIGRAAMEMLEVLPGVTLKDVLVRGFTDEHNLQIGRQPPLSSDKSRTHFPILKEKTGIPYSDMLFFDDSEWSDHCGKVEANCPGVVTQRTPRGMQKHEWDNGLKKFRQSRS